MKGFLKIMEELTGFEELVTSLQQNITPIGMMGGMDFARAHLIYSACAKLGTKALIVVPTEAQAKILYENLDYLDRGNVLFFPQADLLFYDVEAAGRDIKKKRLNVLDSLKRGQKKHVITTVEALCSATVSKEKYDEYSLSVSVGDDLVYEEFLNRIVSLGYRREELVEGAGQFSARGGIVDFFPEWSEMAYRVEFFDTEVDSIRLFDAESQRAADQVETARLTPAQEILADECTREHLIKIIEKLCKKGTASKLDDETKEKLSRNLNRDAERLREGISFPSLCKYIPYLYGKEKPTLLDYIPEDYLIFWDDPPRMHEAAESAARDLAETVTEMHSRGVIAEIPKDGYCAEYRHMVKRLTERRLVGLGALTYTSPDYSPKKLISLTTKAVNSFRGSPELLYDSLRYYMKNQYRIIILAGSETVAQRFAVQLEDEGISCALSSEFADLPPAGHILVTRGGISCGVEYVLTRTVVISDKEIFGSERKRRRRAPRPKGSKIDNFVDLHEGDYIVHQSHGIGKYLGIEQLSVDGVKKDYLKIVYKDGDTLYVPTDQMTQIYKYIGKEGGSVRLNRLGGADWNKTKQRVKASCEDMAEQLIALYAKRESIEGISFSKDTEWQRDFEAAFPYEETEDQLRSIAEVKADMERARPMDRLLCGDVGYGKTEVALRAAFKAVMDGYQVAYLVPTTVLANQHYNTFRQRLRDYPMQCAMLSRFCTASQQREIIKQLASGEIDIVIGTHKLLQKNVKFRKLGLLIIDEEQRFGVAHKEKIKELREEIDVLTLSATPIPRTLHMSMTGIRDMSILSEPPAERYPVATYVLEYDEHIISEAIQKELGRNGQVFYLFNRVQGIQRVAQRLSERFSDTRVAVAHGQMPESELENIMMDMSEGEIDILVCTTIIETGLDIANVNTIIIEDADRMGLSQLYQLRGRVGRSNRLAYAYLTFRRNKVLTEEAEKRLLAIKEFTEFGAGFKVAMRDLEIRGTGNLIGAQQHGHMDAVGYDMYCRLLEEAVRERRGLPEKKKIETLIDLPVSAHIPESYIPSHQLRLEMYKRIAAIETEEDFSDVYDELTDRFGEVEQVVYDLMTVSLIKSYASRFKVTELIGSTQGLVFSFDITDMPEMQRCAELVMQYPKEFSIANTAKPKLRCRLAPDKNNRNSAEYLESVKRITAYLCGQAEEFLPVN